jgi:hypothetical protein
VATGYSVPPEAALKEAIARPAITPQLQLRPLCHHKYHVNGASTPGALHEGGKTARGHGVLDITCEAQNVIARRLFVVLLP